MTVATAPGARPISRRMRLQTHRVIAPSVRIEQTRRRLARLRSEGLVDRITLPPAGRTRAWFPTPYGVQLASEWPEMRGHRPSRTVSDPTAVRLKAGHTLTVTETALAFLKDARRHGELCRPLDCIPEVHHPIGSGEAVIPDALLYYKRGPADGDNGAMLRAFVEVDRATMGPERLGAELSAYERLHRYVPAILGRRPTLKELALEGWWQRQAVSASTTASVWRTPRGSRGSGTWHSRSSRSRTSSDATWG
ncbi:replication-relaxation family protein [Streptomyces sp. NPDC059837]|uniref:replication-relaxation family protein n=1 Tax=unclassified Streptomyces TaxID=2593676 RepID=UPI003656BB4A